MGAFVIPPLDFVALTRFPDSAPAGFVGDYSYGPTLKFGNDGDTITLRCGGEIVDQVNYNGWTVEKGAAFSLDPTHYDTADNDDLGSWCPAVDIYNMVGSELDRGTPSVENPSCG